MLYNLNSTDLAFQKESQIYFLKEAITILKRISPDCFVNTFDKLNKHNVEVNVQIINTLALFTFSNTEEVLLTRNLTTFWTTSLLKQFDRSILSCSYTLSLMYI